MNHSEILSITKSTLICREIFRNITRSNKISLLITDVLLLVQRKLGAAGIEDPQLEAELIVAFVADKGLGSMRADAIMAKSLTVDQAARVQDIAEQRADRVPLQHLTGRAAFRNIELEVGPGVFIPRPETEIVTQFAVDELLADASPEPIAIDFCAGSGAISLAIADEVPNARVWALEYDENAHAWANRNVEKLGQGRVTLMHADATVDHEELKELIGRATVVISNPPYVPVDAIPRDIEVRDHDPAMALYSGADGLDMIRVLSIKAKQYLRPGGLLVLEHAEHQGAGVRRILGDDGWLGAATHQDLTRRDRVTIARA